uniref:Ig-like domain-containing protein n=1 Tax=Sinocyclocheilus anshuiensis TaxID=1608454 RepID=A0A671KA44_9TELE
MEKWATIALFFTAHDLVCWGQDRVEQPSREMTANEADRVTLMCNYTTKATNTDAYLFWYKQLSNKSPAFILNKYPFSEGTTEPDFKKRFSATLDTTSKTVPLMIKNLRVSDSAVYYCALRPTLYKNSNSFFTLISSHIKHTIYDSHNIIILVETPGCGCS